MAKNDGPEVVEVDASGNVIDIEPERQKRGRAKPVTEDALIEACRDFGIDERAISKGGDFRQDDIKRSFWLPLAELLEFERMDVSTDDDGAFWDWFAGFVLEHQLEPAAKKKRKTKRWDDWKGEGWTSWTPRSTQDLWKSWGYSQHTELSKKLALALRVVTKTVDVVNDTGKRYRVQLATDEAGSPVSYTSYKEQLIVISPQALLDTSVDEAYGIDVTTAFGLHEASHVKYSEPLMGALQNPTPLEPLVISSTLHNLVEDVRIEQLTAAGFPGFADHFVTEADYLWKVSGPNVPGTWGPDIGAKMNAVIAATKWPDKYRKQVKDPELLAEIDWWEAWVGRYTAGGVDIRTAIEEGMERLRLDPETSEQMDKLSEQEGDPPTMDAEEFEKWLAELKKQLLGGMLEPCPSPGGAGKPIQLTKEQAAEVERLIGEHYETKLEAEVKFPDGTANVQPLIERTRPLDGMARHYYHAPSGLAQQLREVFFFRKTRAHDPERLLKTGFVDDEQLWRVGFGDTRVFERPVEQTDHSAQVTMLIDVSGSMNGAGLEKAQQLATVMLACLNTMRGVTVRVRAHSTSANGYNNVSSQIYRIYEPGDPEWRLGLLETLEHNTNFDGFAIDLCAQELAEEGEPDDTRLLIVLSDGLPNGTVDGVHYSGGPAMDHMRQVTDHWERQGVTCVQVAVDPDDLRPDQQARMFKYWIGYENDRKLLVDLERLLSKTFGGIE